MKKCNWKIELFAGLNCGMYIPYKIFNKADKSIGFRVFTDLPDFIFKYTGYSKSHNNELKYFFLMKMDMMAPTKKTMI